MRIALLSDIHDHITHLLLALEAARAGGCTHLLFMGDMAELSTFRTLLEEWGHPIDLVFGNNEYQLREFRKMAATRDNTTMHGEIADITLQNRRIFFCHLPWAALKAAESGAYDAVFYGHTHAADLRSVGNTLLVNPGEIYGRQSRPSIAVYDTDTNSARHILI